MIRSRAARIHGPACRGPHSRRRVHLLEEGMRDSTASLMTTLTGISQAANSDPAAQIARSGAIVRKVTSLRASAPFTCLAWSLRCSRTTPRTTSSKCTASAALISTPADVAPKPVFDEFLADIVGRAGDIHLGHRSLTRAERARIRRSDRPSPPPDIDVRTVAILAFARSRSFINEPTCASVRSCRDTHWRHRRLVLLISPCPRPSLRLVLDGLYTIT